MRLSSERRALCAELLNVLRETENDDLTTVLQKLVCSFVDEVTPLAVEITSHLAQTFAKVRVYLCIPVRKCVFVCKYLCQCLCLRVGFAQTLRTCAHLPQLHVDSGVQ